MLRFSIPNNSKVKQVSWFLKWTRNLRWRKLIFENIPIMSYCLISTKLLHSGILVTALSPTGCYKDDPNRCDCKRNVEGVECDTCKSYYYGLDMKNPLGCTRCNCSSFGTVCLFSSLSVLLWRGNQHWAFSVA